MAPHLTPEQLVDIAEGTRQEWSAPHLAACAACRAQLDDLRTALAAAADVDVPEPSPMFWDQLSARVHDAVAAEPPAARWNWWTRAAMPFALGTAAAVVIALVMVERLIAPHGEPAPTTAFRAAPPVVAQPAAPAREVLAPDVTDPSLAIVADLADDIGWDAAREAGLAPRGSADHAVAHMSDGELRQLRTLLQEEMGRSSD